MRTLLALLLHGFLGMQISNDALCRCEITMALAEAACETRLVQCELVTWKRGTDTGKTNSSRVLTSDAHDRMAQQMAAASGRGGELMTWGYCLLLVLCGMLLNAVLAFLWRNTG